MAVRQVLPTALTRLFGKFGGRTRTRTWDPLIKSQLLYHLSYAPAWAPLLGVRAKAGLLAERFPPVQKARIGRKSAILAARTRAMNHHVGIVSSGSGSPKG